MVLLDRMVALLHTHFSFWLSTFFNSIRIFMNCMYTVNLTLRRTSAVQLFQVSWLLLILSMLIVFQHFFTWIALGTVDFHVCVILVTKANAVMGGTTSATWLYRSYQSIHMTGGMTVMSLFATPPTLNTTGHGLCTSHRVKPKSIAYLQCQIALHRKLSHRFWKWCKFSSHIKAKLHLKK